MMSPLNPHPSNLDPCRIVSDLRSKDQWTSLIDGRVDAIHLVGFASKSECSALLDFIGKHPDTVRYTTAPGIFRLGSSFSDIRKAGQVADAYRREDVLVEALAVSGAVSRLIGTIAASWPLGIETLTYDDHVLHRSIARRIVGRGAEAHDDDIAKDIPGHRSASKVRIQMGVNLYIETPEDGGELEGWHRRLSSEEYEAARIPGSYGVHRSVLGDPNWILKPSEGDVVVFNNSEIHAIRASKQARSTWGFFLGFRSDRLPLLIWS